MNQQPAAKAFYIAVAASLVLPFIPVLKYGLLPFDYLNTHLHELCHAIAAMLTGGTVERIEVFSNASGVTFSRGGFSTVILMAGYLGASLFGSAMVQSSNSERSAKVWLRILGGSVLISNILLVRGDAVGWTLGLAWPIVILFLAARIKGDNLLFVAQFFAVQQCLNAVKSLRDLIFLSGTNVPTDANMLAEYTHIPAIIWALLWTGVSLFGIVMAMLKISRKTAAKPAAS